MDFNPIFLQRRHEVFELQQFEIKFRRIWINYPLKPAKFPAESGTRPQFELDIMDRFEVEIGRPGGPWKAESQGFPRTTIRASEDIRISSYGRFEIVPPPARILQNSINRAASGGIH